MLRFIFNIPNIIINSIKTAWLEYKHRIVISRIPYTSGKHKYEIWQWDGKKWIQIIMRIETLQNAIKEANKLK